MKALRVRTHDATINVSFKLTRFIVDWSSAQSSFISGIADGFRDWLPIGPRNFSVTPAFALEDLRCKCRLFGGVCEIVLEPEALRLDFENVKRENDPIVEETVRRASKWLVGALGDHDLDRLSHQAFAHMEGLEAGAADAYLDQFMPAEADELMKSEANVKCLPSTRIMLSGEEGDWELQRTVEKSLLVDNAVFVHTLVHIHSLDPVGFDDQGRLLARVNKLADRAVGLDREDKR